MEPTIVDKSLGEFEGGMEEKVERVDIVDGETKIELTKEYVEKLINEGPIRYKLMLDPNRYVRDAIAELERQLSTARTAKRVRTLTSRIAEKRLELLRMEEIDQEISEENTAEKTDSLATAD